jgi:hypothetical protein
MPRPREIIDQLSHGQALAILKALAAGDEQLADRIAEMGAAYLSLVNLEEVAAVLCDKLDAQKTKASPSPETAVPAISGEGN